MRHVRWWHGVDGRARLAASPNEQPDRTSTSVSVTGGLVPDRGKHVGGPWVYLALYSASVTWSAQLTGPCVIEMWLMRSSWVAPCQCSGPSGCEVDVAGTQLDDRLAAGLHAPAAFCDVESLAARVGVPGGTRSGREVDVGDVECRAALWLDDAVHPDVAGELLGRPLDGRLLRSDVQLRFLSQRSSMAWSTGVAGVLAQLASSSKPSCEGEPGSAL